MIGFFEGENALVTVVGKMAAAFAGEIAGVGGLHFQEGDAQEGWRGGGMMLIIPGVDGCEEGQAKSFTYVKVARFYARFEINLRGNMP